MAKSKDKPTFVCTECGTNYPRWQGQCTAPGCNEWNTVKEFKESKSPKKAYGDQTKSKVIGGYGTIDGDKALKMSQISTQEKNKILTGIGELDRVFGDGITEGSVSLISGDPGAGKTTLLSSLLGVMSLDRMCLFAGAEESSSQVKLRNERIGIKYNDDQLLIMSEYLVENIIAHAIEKKIKFLAIDSIQAMYGEEYSGIPGSIGQVKGCALELNRFAKEHGVTVILIGHVTKGSELAGPKTLEHIVDAIFHLDCNENGLRIMRPSKNRNGSIDNIGIFNMTSRGMISVDNPSKLFLSGTEEPSPGSAVTCIRDGNRNMLLEIQSLVDAPEGEHPQRTCIGLSFNRLKMVIAVLRKHGRLKFHHDTFVNLIGGLKLPETDTSADLALAASLASSLKDKVIPEHTCFMGELALNGSVRPINGGVQRVKEAIKHSFTTIYVPKANYHKDMENKELKVTIVPVATIHDMLEIF
jgi:DNA repair protein RadA/Sms